MSNVHLLDVRWREVTNAFIESMEILPYANRGGVAEGSAQLTGLEAALAIGLVRQSPQEVDRVKIIDVHIHVPGVKTLPPFFDGPPKLVADALLEQMQDVGADVLLGMGQLSSASPVLN